MEREAKNKPCPVCSRRTVLAKVVYDDRYGYPGDFGLLKCSSCRHICLDREFSETEIRNMYTEYYPRRNYDTAEYRPLQRKTGFRSWLKGEQCHAYCYVPRGVRVLDIGCGFGETLGYHQSRQCAAHGVDVDENVGSVAKELGFNVKIGLFDSCNYKKQFFDYVTIDQVLEHLIEPIAMLLGIVEITKPGGTVIISTPNVQGWGARLFGEKWIHWHTPYHLNFFSRDSIRRAAKKTGLQLKTIKTRTSSEWIFYQLIHLFTHPRAGMPSEFWAADGELNVKGWRIGAVRFTKLLHKLGVTHLTTRLFDWLGYGDNFLIVLEIPRG